MPKRKTTEEFIEDAIKIHKEKYGYDNVVYKNCKTKVEIYCKNCNKYFMQTPSEHLDGCGCPTCGRNNVKSKLYGVGVNDLDEPISHNGKHFKFYLVWKSMMYRCYYKGFHKRENTYSDCFVCEEWTYLSNFKRWFDENYVDGYELDKDILSDGNREYAPNKCCFVPKQINNLIKKSQICYKSIHNGITKSKKDNFCVTIQKRKRKIVFKGINSLEESINIYNEEKTKYIHELADEYYSKHKITESVYEALKRYRFINKNGRAK